MFNAKLFRTPGGSRGRSGLCLSIGLLLAALVTACSDGDNHHKSAQPPAASTPFAELYDQGIDRYIGVYSPMFSEESGGTISYTFGAGDGPLCLDGSPYRMATRDAGSGDLLIYLQGGGACWSDTCIATENADPAILQVGILNPDREDNPVRDYNLVYLPYCDGGLFASDRDSDSDGDGVVDRFQRGLHNLSAGLDVALATFPAPRRIVLMGASGGGLGTTFALPLVRRLYPDVPIDIVNDSGVGIGRPGEPEFLQRLIDEWNIGAFFPASCVNCIAADGHLSDYHVWQLDQDPNVRRGMLSYARDTVFADVYLKIGQAAFQAALLPEMQQLEDAHPERSHYWVPDGAGHTFLQLAPDTSANGVPLFEWIGFMLDGSEAWISETDLALPN